jgi:CBS domain-containing protein
MDITLESVLRRKGREVFSISPDSTLYEALKELADKNVGALLVLESEKMVGIISERDYARKVVLQGKSSRNTTVREVMTPDVIAVGINETIENCMDLMTRNKIRHLPVVKDGAVAGIISIGDIVKAIISEQQATIQDLEQYIVGGR